MSASAWAKIIFALIVLAIGAAAAIWLAGFLFFALAKTNPIGKTNFGTWWLYWSFYKDDPAIAKRLLIALGVAVAGIFGLIIAGVLGARGNAQKLYGDARFATTAEIARAGLFAPAGIIVGKVGKRFLMFGGAQFAALAAPTRSGKGVAIVIPNLLNWPQSLVALDVKLENFLITSKYRHAHGHEVYLFNPFAKDGRTHRYNPLGYISDNPRLRVEEILSIGYSLYPGTGREAFFDDAARNLFLGLCLYLCETPLLPRTMGELLRQSSGKGKPVKEYLQGIITERNYREVVEPDAEGELVTVLQPITNWDGKGLPPLSMECVDALNRFTSTSDNTLSSIMATFNVPLTLWASATFDAATSANDFDLRDVRKKRMAIYLGIPANKLAEARLVLNMFYDQLVKLNTDVLLGATPALKYQCLLVNDEFSAPGRIASIDDAVSYMAGYGLRLLTIYQSPGQLMQDPPRGYGRAGARSLLTNHALQILFTPREQEDAREYSEILGYYTYKATGRSRQLGRGGGSESESDQKRPLMMPQELREMSQRTQIISMENCKPIKCDKIVYFSERVFIDRLRQVSPTLQGYGRRFPSESDFKNIWGSWELAAPVPFLDLDLHEAVVHARTREAKPADVAPGFDLQRLALDTSKIKTLAADQELTDEEAESYVLDFFSALEASPGAVDDPETVGAEDAVDDDELAALDAAAAAESADEDEDDAAAPASAPAPARVPAPAIATEHAADGDLASEHDAGDDYSPDEDEPHDAAGDDVPEIDPSSEVIELDALWDDMPDQDDFPPADVDHPDDEVFEDHDTASAPILDLSVLDKPTGR